MTRRQLKKQLRDAVLSTTPDVLDKVLSATPQQIAAAKEFKEELPVRKNHFKAAASAVAALFVFVMGAVFFSQPKVDSIVSIDVNPSFELSVDNRDRVLECTAVNDEAAKVLEGMTLEKMDLDTATAQIISSMRTHGYLAPEKTDNTILISVANSDVKKAEELKNKVSASVSTALKSNQTSARLIQQSDVLTPEVQKFAKEQGISVGKADLVKKLSEKDSELDPNTLSNLSITEISSIIDEKDIDVSDVLTEYTPEQQGGEPSGGNASSEGTTSSEAPPSSNSPEGSGESSEPPASSEQPSSKPSDSGDTPVIDSGKYCEYCGKLSTVCQGKCSHKNGKLYCPDCGNRLLLCICGETSSEPSGEGTDAAYCEYCGRHLDECQGLCDQSWGKRYCADCGKLYSKCQCKDSGRVVEEPYFGPHNPGWYCEYCGRLNSRCRGKCDTSGGKIYCSECGKSKYECTCEEKKDDEPVFGFE